MKQPRQINERRDRQRCPGLAYTATVQRTGLRRFSKPYMATIVDFHRFGACLCADKRITVGAKIGLSIKSTSEEVRGITAVVCHVRSLPTGYWFGIKFLHSSQGGGAGRSVLASLETMIKKQLA